MAKVKRIKSKKKKKVTKKKVARKKMATRAPKQEDYSGLELPTEKKKASTDLRDYTLMVYGREKIGKTTFFASFPDALFLTTEPGTKGLEIYEFNSDDGGCRDWSIVRRAVDLIEANPGPFKNVIFDTVDRAYDMCLDWVCKDLNIEYPGQDAMGREDYGRSWRAVKQEFMSVIHRILQAGLGICFTSHAIESEVRSRSGDRYTRIFPSMSNQGRKVIEALVDLFFYAEYVKDTNGQIVRVLITEGDEVIWAGHRKCEFRLPRFIPITEEGGYDILDAAFHGAKVGLNPDTFMPTRGASEAVKKFIRKSKTEKIVETARKKKKKKRS